MAKIVAFSVESKQQDEEVLDQLKDGVEDVATVYDSNIVGTFAVCSFIFTGLQISMGFAWFSLVAGEMLAVEVAGRPAISRMHLVSSGLDVTATVTLTSDGRTAAGESRNSASQSGVQRAVASATLRAVEELSGDIARFELDHLEVTHLGSDRMVIVALTMLSSRGTERLTGAAAVREDVRQAVIRATLDALNRRLETLLT